MRNYLNLLKKVLAGNRREDRTRVGTIGTFGERLEFDVSLDKFPIVTTKEINFDAIRKELEWFLRGETNINTLGCHIWDEWADDQGDLGPIYGKQWTDWNGNQIDKLVKDLINNPYGRRHIVSAWNVGELDQMALPPCHIMFQCYVDSGVLSLQLYQRSCDMFLGVPFNISSYCLLLLMLCEQTGYYPGKFIWVGGDCHIYENHIEQVMLQLERVPYPLPSIRSGELVNYKHWPAIKG